MSNFEEWSNDDQTYYVHYCGEISDCCACFSEFAFQMEIDEEIANLPLLPRMENFLGEFEELPVIPSAYITCEEEPTEEQVQRRNLTDHSAVVFSC